MNTFPQGLRMDLAGIAMGVLMAQYISDADGNGVFAIEDRSKLIAQQAVKYADALLAELAKQPE
jgi:hypothetical protein